MKKHLLMMFGATAIAAAVMMSGCGKSGSGKVELDKPVDQIKTEAQTLNVDALNKQADVYRKELDAQKPKMAALEKKLKDTPVMQMLSADTAKLKDDIANMSQTMSKTTERLNIYIDEIKKKGGEVTTPPAK